MSDTEDRQIKNLLEGSSKTADYMLWSYLYQDTTFFAATVHGKPEYSDLYYRVKSPERARVESAMRAVLDTHDALLWDNTQQVSISKDYMPSFDRSITESTVKSHE